MCRSLIYRCLSALLWKLGESIVKQVEKDELKKKQKEEMKLNTLQPVNQKLDLLGTSILLITSIILMFCSYMITSLILSLTH